MAPTEQPMVQSTDGPSARVGFIGLGTMGGPMARNLVAAGFDVHVADLDPERVALVVAAGATAADGAAEAASSADVVFTSLPGPREVLSVGTALLAAMRPGSIWVDLSTSDLPTARTLADLAVGTGVALVDGPVTGGVEGAEAGTLTVLVGGDPATHERVRPMLEAIGDRCDRLGPHGAGYVAKIASVSLCYLHSVCLTEALLLGASGGVDPGAMLDVIQHSTGRSYVADRYGPEILGGGYDDSFALGLAVKDLRLADELAATLGVSLPTTAAVLDRYRSAEATFGHDAPHLIAVQTLERENDLVLHEHERPTPSPDDPDPLGRQPLAPTARHLS